MKLRSVLLSLALAGCGGSESAKKESPRAAGEAPYDASRPLGELMIHVVQYAADGIWERQGFVIDKDGEHSLFPKDDEEWHKAESAAQTLAEVTNTLLVPGRRIAESEWDKAVIEVRRIAIEAAQAAEKQDKDAFFAAGSKLDAACDGCHARYDPKFDPRFQH